MPHDWRVLRGWVVVHNDGVQRYPVTIVLLFLIVAGFLVQLAVPGLTEAAAVQRQRIDEGEHRHARIAHQRCDWTLDYLEYGDASDEAEREHECGATCVIQKVRAAYERLKVASLAAND